MYELPRLRPKWLRFLAVGALPLAVSFHGLVTFTGPYRWIADFEQSLWGNYHPQLCLVVSAVGTLFLGTAFLALLVRTGIVPSQPNAGEDRAREREASEARWNQRLATFNEHRAWLLCFAFGVAFFFAGAREASQLSSAKTLEQVSIDDLEQGKRPQSTWLQLRGQPAHDQAVSHGAGSGSVYVPVMSGSWREGDKVAGVVTYDPAESTRIDFAMQRGIVTAVALPVPVAQLWREAGLDASNALILELGVHRQSLRTRMEWELCLGALGFLAGVLIFLYRRWRRAGGGSAPSLA